MNDASERHHAFAAHRLANDRKRFLPDRIVRPDVIGAVEIALVDLAARDERVDLDHVVALDLDRLDLLVLDQEIGVLRIFVSAALVGRLDRLAGDVVDELLAQPIAGLLVELAERHPLAGGRGGIEPRSGRKRGPA